MRLSTHWTDFEVIDASKGEKLERWGDVLLIRPEPQAIWQTPRGEAWGRANARYIRSRSGGGRWEVYYLPAERWSIGYRDLRFLISPTGFKHTGLFPEQAVNWEAFGELIQNRETRVKVLNLFAYTGGATLACAAAGAQVVHVDASKGMVAWARENAKLSSLADKPVRWIVDDCKQFVQREIRRGNRYDGIIMDPPSYGRGPVGQVWKLEEHLFELVSLTVRLLSDRPLFFALNSYSTGLSASVMRYILGVCILQQHGGAITAEEIGLPVKSTGLPLPCGSTALWTGE